MAERSLRGMRLGAQSLQTEEGVEYSPRVRYQYQLANGEVEDVVFAREVQPPLHWPCAGGEGTLVNSEQLGVSEDQHDEKPARTHWDMLLERRSPEELEETLQERLTYLRERRAAARAHMEELGKSQ